MKTGGSYQDFEAMKQEERAAYLLAGYIQYDLTAEEEEELDKWILASEENMRLFEEMTDEKQMAAYLRWYESRDIESRLEETRERLLNDRKPGIRSFWKYAAAAAIIITAGIIAFVWKPFTGIEKPPVIQIPPGQATGAAPILKLDDGRIIQLSGIGDTVINDQVKISNGMVVYNEKATDPPAFHELTIPRKTSYQLLLPDGSRVWLNAASSIRYPSSFQGKTREVIVTGESYFEIAKDTARPFIVMVNGIRVQATGTAFNIKAYPEEPYLGITLTEGSVKVSTADKSRALHVSEQLQIRNAQNWSIKKVDTDDVTAWTNNKLQLSDMSIDELKHNLERWYDITVIVQDKIEKHLNGTFPRDIPLTTLLPLLERTNDVHFKLDGNRVTVLK